ncbi:hypothetical protein O1611_g8730 [Lasiodiplodia mahajangana]|uniref:Uncharacterized protein n=1 Tax=Lasiodiplodia mahajangana TaxID=1108764 RepID=A0ACC2JBP8_9PEZI|nr:hypothetical protein O1611_g8730 [Lasiodiplodia mahajangana]
MLLRNPLVKEASVQEAPTPEPPVQEDSTKEVSPQEVLIKEESLKELPADEVPVIETPVEPTVEEPAADMEAEAKEAHEEAPAQDSSAAEPIVEAAPSDEAPAPALAPEEAPAFEGTVAPEEAPASEGVQAPEGASTTEDNLASGGAAAAEETPAGEEVSAAEVAPAVVEDLVTEEIPDGSEEPPAEEEPVVKAAPVAEEAAATEMAPPAEEPVAEQSPSIEEPAPVEEASVAEEASPIREAPAAEQAPAEATPVIEEVLPSEEEVAKETSVEISPSAEAPPAIEEVPTAEIAAPVDETPIIEQAPAVEEPPVAEKALTIEEAPAVEESSIVPVEIVERELPTTEAAAIATETRKDVSPEIPPVAAEPDAPKPQPDAAEKRKERSREDKAREAEESKDVVGPIRGEEKSSRKRSRGKEEPLPYCFEDASGVEANDIGGDEPEPIPENALPEKEVVEGLSNVEDDSAIQHRISKEAPQRETLVESHFSKKLGDHPVDAATREVNFDDPDPVTSDEIATYPEHKTPSGYPRDSRDETHGIPQNPDTEGGLVADENDSHMNTSAPAARTHAAEPPGFRVYDVIETPEGRKVGAISAIQRELPSSKDDYVTTNICEPAEDTAAGNDRSFAQSSSRGNEFLPVDQQATAKTISSTEDSDILYGISSKSDDALKEVASFVSEEAIVQGAVHTHGMANIERPSSLAMPGADIFPEPVTYNCDIAVVPLSEDSVLDREKSNEEPPLLRHELLHAPMMEHDDQTVPENWPFVTDHTAYTPIIAESVHLFGDDSAWETVDEDQTSEQVWETTDDDEALGKSWGDIEVDGTHNILSTISEAAHEPNEGSGGNSENSSEEAPHNFMPPEALSHNLSNPSFLHSEKLNPQPREGETTDQYSAPHEFTSTGMADEEHDPSDNHESRALKVAPLRPLGTESSDVAGVAESQRQPMFEDSRAWGVFQDSAGSRLENSPGSSYASSRRLQYFDTLSEDSDDEFIVKKSGASQPTDNSDYPHSSTRNEPMVSSPNEALVETIRQRTAAEQFAEATDIIQDSNRSTGPLGPTLDESLIAAENESQGWSTTSEEYSDTEGEIQHLPHIFDYTGFISERPAIYNSREVEDFYSDDESEEEVGPAEPQKHSIGHSNRELNITHGEPKGNLAPQYNHNWPFTRSSSRDKSEQMNFEPLLDDERLGTIDVAFAPTKTLATGQVQNRSPENTGISGLERESVSSSKIYDANASVYPYSSQQGRSDKPQSFVAYGSAERDFSVDRDGYFRMPSMLNSVAGEIPARPTVGDDTDSMKATSATEEIYAQIADNHFMETSVFTAGAAAIATDTPLLAHSPPTRDEERIARSSSSRGLRRSISNSPSRDSEFIEELPIVPTSVAERARFELLKHPLLAKVEASANQDYRDRDFQLESVPSSLFEDTEPLRMGVDQAEDSIYFEKRPIPPRSSRRIRPTLVHSGTQTDEGLLYGASFRPSPSFYEEPRSPTPVIVLPDLGDPKAKALGRARSLKKKREQYFREVEETVATAVVIYATAQELSPPLDFYPGDGQFNKNFTETWDATQGPVQMMKVETDTTASIDPTDPATTRRDPRTVSAVTNTIAATATTER